VVSRGLQGLLNPANRRTAKHTSASPAFASNSLKYEGDLMDLGGLMG